jgi:hypothetical protein
LRAAISVSVPVRTIAPYRWRVAISVSVPVMTIAPYRWRAAISISIAVIAIAPVFRLILGCIIAFKTRSLGHFSGSRVKGLSLLIPCGWASVGMGLPFAAPIGFRVLTAAFSFERFAVRILALGGVFRKFFHLFVGCF